MTDQEILSIIADLGLLIDGCRSALPEVRARALRKAIHAFASLLLIRGHFMPDEVAANIAFVGRMLMMPDQEFDALSNKISLMSSVAAGGIDGRPN